MRDDRKGGTKESVNLVRECKVMAKEEVWSGWNQVETQVQISQPRGLEEAETWN